MLTTTVAGRTWDFVQAIGRNAAAGNGFTQPTDVACAGDGVMYVLSRGTEGAGGVVVENKRIGKVTMDSELLGDFGRREFVWPASLAVDSEKNLYCTDEHLNFVAKYDSDGQRLGQWGEVGAGEGQFNAPSGLCFDKDDNVYIVDTGNNRIQKYTKDGQFLSQWGSAGSGDGQFNAPWGLTIDPKGDVYVADFANNRVQKFSPDGTHLMNFGSSNGSATDLDHPADVAVDSEGDVYISDWGNKRVQIYDPDGTELTSLWGDAIEFSKWAKEVVDANPDVIKAYRRVDDKTPLGRFERPVGLAIDEKDRLIVTDSTRGRIQIYQKESNFMDAQFNL